MTWDNQAYLKGVQYRDTSNLDARMKLHAKYGRADWYPWLAAQADIKAGARCLDVGCGTGAFWAAVARTFPAGIGLDLVDLSAAMVQTALRTLNVHTSYAWVSGRVGDAQALSFSNATFDRVLAAHVLQHVPDVDKAVHELRRVLKPGGKLLVVQNDRNHMRQLQELTTRLFGSDAQDRSMQMLGAKKILAALRKSFADVDVIPFEDDLECTDPIDVMDYALSVYHVKDDPAQFMALSDAVDKAFADGGGTFRIAKDVKLFRCTC